MAGDSEIHIIRPRPVMLVVMWHRTTASRMSTSNEPKLTDFRTHDGARQFLSLPQSQLWYAVRDHVAKLNGATLTGFVCDDVTEAWIDFTCQEHSFTINDQYGEYWFFANDPECPESILRLVAAHFAKLLA